MVVGVERGLSELLWFSRGEIGIDHKNFSRKLRGGGAGVRNPEIEYANI